MKLVSNSSTLILRNTPWDEKVIGAPTNEIIEMLECNSVNDIQSLLKQFEEHCTSNKIAYSNIRISAQNKSIKQCLQLAGFQFVESSIEVVRSILDFNIDIRLLKQTEKIEIVNYHHKYLVEIKQIACNEFNYGRFAEDTNLNNSYNAIRNSNWIDNLAQKNEFKVLLYKQQPIGFMAYEINNCICNLILGGVHNSYQHFAPAFWSVILKDVKTNLNVNSVKTIISAANIGVFNLYIKLGFTIKTTYWGFSKIRNTYLP